MSLTVRMRSSSGGSLSTGVVWDRHTGSVRKQMIWLYMLILSQQDNYVNGCYANVIVDYVWLR